MTTSEQQQPEQQVEAPSLTDVQVPEQPQPALTDIQVLEKLRERAAAQQDQRMVTYYDYTIAHLDKCTQFLHAHPNLPLPLVYTGIGWKWASRQEIRKMTRRALKMRRKT